MLKLCNASKQDRSACKQWSCLTKDLLRVVDPLNSMKISSSSPTSQLFTVRHLETILHMNKCRDTNWRSSSPVDSTVGWRSSDCWQLHFEPSSARLFSSPSLSIVWSNYQNYIHRLLWSLLSFLRGEWMFDHGYCPLTQASTRQKKASY